MPPKDGDEQVVQPSLQGFSFAQTVFPFGGNHTLLSYFARSLELEKKRFTDGVENETALRVQMNLVLVWMSQRPRLFRIRWRSFDGAFRVYKRETWLVRRSGM
jgi:hypothetical protein